MSTQHTPGPWEQVGFSIKDKDGPIAQCIEWTTNGEPNYADAKLIAAAPDLLESIKKLVEEISENAVQFRTMQEADEAIKKATE